MERIKKIRLVKILVIKNGKLKYHTKLFTDILLLAKTKEEAEEILDKHQSHTEEIDEYGKTFRETIQSKVVSDMEGDETKTWEKVEECIPSDDTDSDNDFAHFINYDEPTWSKDDYEWLKKEDGTDIKNDNHS